MLKIRAHKREWEELHDDSPLWSIQRGEASVELTAADCDRLFWAGVTLLCVLAFAVMTWLAANTGLWLDEIFEVEYCREAATPLDIVLIDPYTPPLFNLIAWCWYQLVPYGEVWLRLPSILFVTLAALLLALTGRRVGGRRVGFVAATLLLINAKVITQCALTFRTYGLLLCLGALLTYLHVRRVQTPNERLAWRFSTLYALTLLALGYTHYFGVLLACGFFVVDVVLAVRGHLKGACPKVFAPYAVAVVYYLPWLSVALATLSAATSSESTIQWQAHAADVNMHEALYWLFGECAETLGLYHIGLVLIVVVGAWHCVNGTFEWRRQTPPAALLVAGMLGLAVMWVYCRFVNPASMFWVNRYFLALLPCMMLVTAWAVVKIFSWPPVPSSVCCLAAVLCVALLIPTSVGTVNNDLAEGSSTRFYHDLTDYLLAQDDIEDDGTLVLALIDTSDRNRQVLGWKHYYLDRKDTQPTSVTIVDGLDASVQLNPYDLLQYQTVYVTCQHFSPEIPETYLPVLKKYFKRHKTDNPGGGETYRYTRK